MSFSLDILHQHTPCTLSNILGQDRHFRRNWRLQGAPHPSMSGVIK